MGNKAYRGVDKFYVAKVLTDDAGGITYGTPYNIAAVQHVTREVGEDSAKVYADNKAVISVKGAGSPTATFTTLNIPAKELADLLGQTKVGNAMIASNGQKEVYFGIMYRLKNTDNTYTYVGIGKARFNAPSDDVETQNDGTDVTLMSLSAELMGTIHEFNIDGKQASYDYLTVDEVDGQDYSTTFFSEMQTPDTIGPLQNIVSVPVANPQGGTVETGTSVTLTSGTTGSSIYYTVDGTEPTTSSTLYESGITITADMTIKAIAVKASMQSSEVMTAVYDVL